MTDYELKYITNYMHENDKAKMLDEIIEQEL